MAELINNRERRIQTLKDVIRGLHRGEPVPEVKRKLRELVRVTDATEIAAMEQQLMSDGMPVSEVMAMCDLHAQVTRDITKEAPRVPLVPGHPVETFRRENRAIEQAVAEIRPVLAALAEGPEDAVPPREAVLAARSRWNALMDVDKHYLRKEHLLFPLLERHAITGPSKVMWGKDDEARELLKGLGEALAAETLTAGEWKLVGDTVAEPALSALLEMVQKEEVVLLPMSLGALTEAEWAEIHEQSSEIGYCLVEPGTEYEPAEHGGSAPAPSVADPLLRTPTGVLSHAELAGILRSLPADLTFVDADDRVRFFTEGAERVFVRPRVVIGRKVQHCHPPASVHIVEKILDDFRSGREDACTFWIDFRGRFVTIRYVAVRDDAGRYLGTLEVTQDVSAERALTGERRLLEYDRPNGARDAASETPSAG